VCISGHKSTKDPTAWAEVEGSSPCLQHNANGITMLDTPAQSSDSPPARPIPCLLFQVILEAYTAGATAGPALL